MLDENNTQEISPLLEAFLDADDFEEKYKIIVAASVSDFTDLIIDNMASSMDVVVKDGHIESRIEDLKYCVRTRAHFETTRLRR